ncbi:transmembrane protein, putative (macronuclear) [Tetrahymena thermophila SB210]|uniref:Transmembrane protein, putative n=1 Tax=Tetrahymena thermophila (strain SB210) TaxID=312017 RepID=Q238V6_TETTS|nr:transmembrane protein, putative [Tetrahymena thermophila SB210]EAR93114.2 transmembrane protein, putative [Tetrahymena thermophila SB210]|eukprot:XP_001013359.2 transmembrane protein, putative [Tetrahymena thermophila SB210]
MNINITLVCLAILFIIKKAFCQPCDFIGETAMKKIKLTEIYQQFQANQCKLLTINNVQIDCSDIDTTKLMFTFKINDLELTKSVFSCDNIEVQAKNAIINDSFLGRDKIGRCCSFLDQYNFYLQASETITLKGMVRHQKGKYGMLIFNADKEIKLTDATVIAGNIAIHSLSDISIKNSEVSSQFIFCHESLQNQYSIQNQYAPEKFMQIQYVQQGDVKVAQYEIVKIQDILKDNKNKFDFTTDYDFLYDALKYQYSILIYSQGIITVSDNSNFDGSRMAFFSSVYVISKDSLLNSTAQGCPADYGLGKGLYFDTVENCAPNGASQASQGGIGLPKPDKNGNFLQQDINQCVFYKQQTSFILQNIPYSYSTFYEGSGGSFRDANKRFYGLGQEGAGGGMIFIYTSKEAYIDGYLESNGASLQILNGSGGSGGAILIKATKIHGQGKISAQGGASDQYGLSGEGAGGIINMYQLNWDIDKNINQFNGTININQGQRSFQSYNLSQSQIEQVQANKGTFISFICPPGYEPQQNGFCKPCDVGFYKSGLVGKCIKCQKPMQFDKIVVPTKDQSKFESLGDCYQNCIEFNCDPLRIYVKNVISIKIIPFFIAYLAVLCLGYISRRILRMKPKKIDSIPIQHVKYDYDDSIFATECKEKDIFFYRDLLYHKYRLQFYGENNINSQWYLQPQIPEGTEQIFDQRDFAEFAQKVNQTLKWKKIDIIILNILNYLYYPLYWFYLTKVQKKIYKKIKDKIHDEPYPKFLKGSDAVQQKYIRMKITKSDDYSILSLDLFNYSKRNQKYFKKTIPTIIHFSGEGSYLKPYYIWPRDHFLQSVFYSTNSRTLKNKGNPNNVNVFCSNYKYHRENSQTFEKFIQELNKISSTIDFYSDKSYLFKCFQELIQHCRQFNEDFLYQLDLKLQILIMEIPFNDYIDVETRQLTNQLQNFQESYKQRITLVEDENSLSFQKTIERIQIQKMIQSPIDMKVSLFIFSTSEDIEELKINLIPELEIEQEAFQSKIQQYNSTHTVNPFNSIDYQSTKHSKIEQQANLQDQKDEFRESRVNKQSITEFMQNIIDKQNNNQTNDQDKKDMKKIYKKLEKKQKTFSKIIIQIGILMGFLRFLFLSHRNTKTEKEMLIYVLTVFIILDIFSMTFFFNNIYYAKVENFQFFDFILVFIPFPFVLIITPFIGLFLLTNQSYGMGKAYFIFNFMALIVILISLFLSLIYIPYEGFNLPIFFIKMSNIVIKLLISYCGNYSLLALDKLNRTTMYKK